MRCGRIGSALGALLCASLAAGPRSVEGWAGVRLRPARVRPAGVVRAAELDPFVPAPGAAPPMTWSKFVTMSKKRIVVTIHHDRQDLADLAKLKIKQLFPDAIVECLKRDEVTPTPASLFEILVDGKIVWSGERRGVVYLNRFKLQTAIEAARRRRRPRQVVYGDPSTYEQYQNRLLQQHWELEQVRLANNGTVPEEHLAALDAGVSGKSWKMANPPLLFDDLEDVQRVGGPRPEPKE